MMKAIALFLLFTASNFASDWPQFLGAKRDGVSPEEVRSTFDPEPKIAWEHKLGTGLAGPAIASGVCIIFHRVDDLATVDALDASTGKPLWQFTYPTNYQDDFGFDPGPRSTPTIHKNRVYTYGAEGMLHCLSLKNGNKIWAVDTTEKPGSGKGFFGRASAPMIHDNSLIIQLDGITGFDVGTGKVKWQTTKHEAGYASPTLATLSGKTYSLHLTREGFVCLDPSDGNLVIEKRFRAKMHASVNAATPIVIAGNKIFLSACYDVGATLLQIDPNAPAHRELWAKGDILDAHYATPVLVEKNLYGFHGRQETGQELRCINPVEGTVNWSQKLPTGSVVAAGKQLIVLTEKGELILAPADSKAFKPTARGQILGATTRAFPALANGFFYARDSKKLVAVDLSKD